jgi:hypothetical protein
VKNEESVIPPPLENSNNNIEDQPADTVSRVLELGSNELFIEEFDADETPNVSITVENDNNSNNNDNNHDGFINNNNKKKEDSLSETEYTYNNDGLIDNY